MFINHGIYEGIAELRILCLKINSNTAFESAQVYLGVFIRLYSIILDRPICIENAKKVEKVEKGKI
jgi:hypothetical protein